MSRTRPHPRREDLLALVDGELEFERAQNLEEHCSNCAGCRDELERLQIVENSLVALPRPALDGNDLARMLNGIGARLDAVDGGTQEAVEWRRSWRSTTALVLAAAAVLVIGIALGRRWDTAPNPQAAPRDSIVDAAPRSTDPSEAAEPSTSVARPSRSAQPDSLIVVAESSRDLDPDLSDRALERNLRTRSRVREALLEGARDPSRSLWSDLADLPTWKIAATLVQCAESDGWPVRSLALEALARAGSEFRPSQLPATFTWTLERWLKGDATHAVAYSILLALDAARDESPRDLSRAWTAALARAELHGRAVVDRCTRVREAADWREVDRLLRELLRSSDESELALWERGLAALPSQQPELLDVLYSQYDEGAPRSALEHCLAQLGGEARDVLLARLVDGGREQDERAIRFVAMGRWDSAVPALVGCVRRGRHAAAALDALQSIGSATAATELLRLAQDGSLANSRRSQARDSLIALLGESAEPREVLARTLEAGDAIAAANLIALLPRLPAATSSELLLAVAEDETRSAATRSLAALHLAERATAVQREKLLDLLARERANLADRALGESLAAPLLVSLYSAEPRQSLQGSLQLAGWKLDARRCEEIDHLAALAAAEPFASRTGERLARIEQLLRSGP